MMKVTRVSIESIATLRLENNTIYSLDDSTKSVESVRIYFEFYLDEYGDYVVSYHKGRYFNDPVTMTISGNTHTLKKLFHMFSYGELL